MKKLIVLGLAAFIALAASSCGSLRTPTSGPNANNVYYHTFFGLSIESAVYGDGIVVSPINK